MKKFLFMMAVSAVALTSSNAMAAEAEGKGTAKAKIVAPMTVSPADGILSFGTLLQGDNKVTVDPDGQRTATEDKKYVGGQNSGVKAATFNLEGPAGAQVTINPATFTAGKLSGPGGAEMTVSNFTTSKNSLTLTGDAGNTSARGSGTFNVGADLLVGATQAPGDYSGEFTVVVSY